MFECRRQRAADGRDVQFAVDAESSHSTRREVRKSLSATRKDINDWRSVVPEDELAALRQGGYFLDLRHRRAHRSNPIDVADDEVIFDTRSGDAGEGPVRHRTDP